MSKTLVEVEALDLMEQLGHELVIEYEADGATVAVIVAALIAFQELTPAITVGTIAAAYTALTRSIKVDGDTILRALFRLRDTVGGYLYVDNDRKLQWAASIGEDTGQQIRYRKNLTGIERTIDYSTLVNRLYCYGAGEDTARIKLSDADGHAVDYVEDATSQGAPPGGWGGIYIGVMVDKSITDPDTLLAWANLKLAEVKDPPIAYRVDTVDLSKNVNYDFSFDVLQLGSTVTVIDEDLGIDVSVVVVRIDHPDLLHPERMTLELSTRTKDISDSLLEVYDTQQFEQHVATTIGAGQVIVKGVFTVQDWATGDATTIDGDNIETGTITATKIDVDNIAAIKADLGTITAGDIRLGSGTVGVDFTGIRIYKDGATYRVAGINDDDLQAYLDSDGIFKAATGNVVLDSDGITINQPSGAYGPYLNMEYGGDVKGQLATAYDQFGILGIDQLYLDSGSEGTTISSDGDVVVDPTGHDLRPLAADDVDLGTDTYYFRHLEIVDIAYHSPMKMAVNALEKVQGIRTKVVDGVEIMDKSTMPMEILRIPDQQSYDKAAAQHLRDLKSYNSRFESLRHKMPERANHLKRPVEAFPTVAVNSNDLFGLIISSIQELSTKVDALHD